MRTCREITCYVYKDKQNSLLARFFTSSWTDSTRTGNTEQLDGDSNDEKCSPSRMRLHCGHAVYYLQNLITSSKLLLMIPVS